jgi:putative ABC transport system permease protein
MKLTSNYTGNPGFLIFMIITLIFTGLLAGSYPALYISKFQPIAILKGKLKFGGTSFFTRALLTLQFAISLIAIVSSFAFTGNAQYQQDLDLGFDHKGVVFTYVDNGNEFEIYKNALAENPQILSIAGSKNHVFSSTYNDPIKHEGKEIEVDIMDVGDNYLKTTGFHLVAGRDFQKDSETDYKESVIITEKLADKFGWDKPIGKEIIWMDTVRLYVIGVVKDAYTQGLWREMQPMMIRYTPQKNYTHIIASAAPKNIVKVNEFMEKKWKQLFPNRAYHSKYMDDEIADAALVNENIVKMFVFLGIVAMMLSATGLFTLVSLNILKKMKEIGVRKVFGASAGNIAGVINLEFVIILLIASVLGAFGGAYLSAILMRSIWNYYQPAGALILGVSVIILFVISALTIGFKVYAAAKMNPISTLRDE